MKTNLPFICKRYKVISGYHKGFRGDCVSYDMEHDLPIILQDLNYNCCAVRLNEIEEDGSGEMDISMEQKN